MYAELKRDVSHNYLILRGEQTVDTSSYQVRMLTGNVIPSVLKCHLQNLDGKELFYYDITSRQSIAVLFEEKKFREEDLQLIFGGVVHAIEELTEFLMNPELLILQPEYIYLDVESRAVYFCCLPGAQKDIQTQFRSLTEYILPKLNHEDPGAVKLGYGIYRKTLEEGFGLEAIKAAVYQLQETPEEEVCTEEVQREPVSCEEENAAGAQECPRILEESASGIERTEHHTGSRKNFPVKMIAGCGVGVLVLLAVLGAGVLGLLPWVPIELVMGAGILLLAAGALAIWIIEKKKRKKEDEAQWRQKVKKEPVYKPESDSDATRTQEDQPEEKNEILGETVVLSAGMSSGPASLVSREPGELATIFLDQELIVVGKLINAADAVIPVPTVSRVHARIRKKEGGYYLADLNSRNGTSVNGRMLKADEEYLLQDEDQVDFAQARYVFVK